MARAPVTGSSSTGCTPGTAAWRATSGPGRGGPGGGAWGAAPAVAGGLPGWTSGRSAPEPVFCADAIADPLTGVCGALAVGPPLAGGGGGGGWIFLGGGG